MRLKECFQISLKLTTTDLEKLDAIAAKKRLSRAAYVRLLIGNAIDEEKRNDEEKRTNP